MNMIMCTKSIRSSALIYLILIFCPLTFAATTVQLDHERVSQNDTFRLILSSDEINKGGLPNLTPLKKEFDILGTEHNVSYNMINGQTSASNQWIIVLRPKKTGKLNIPSIRIGSEQTESRSIDVSDDAQIVSSDDAKSGMASDAVMLKTEVSESNPYVNQQVLYTVKLYNNQRLIGAQYHPPSVQDALMIPFGDERHYQTQENGQTYMVEEQQYAIFPQKSGAMSISPPSFETAIFDEGYPKRLHLKGPKTPITIRPAPSDYPYKNWLPAKNVTLAETYDVAAQDLKEGDTITRNVTLQASAMPAQLLPALEFNVTSQFKVYPESPETKNTIKPNEIVGVSTVKVTYLLSEAGDITIPKLDVPWFNVSTGKTEIASLPSNTLKVLPGNATSKKPTASQNIISSQTTPRHPAPEKSPSLSFNSSSLILAVVIGFLSGLVVVLLILWLRKDSFFAKGKARDGVIKRVLSACDRNMPRDAHDALLAWATIWWPEKTILNLHDIAIHCRDIHLKKELAKLSQLLYDGRAPKSWDGARLRECFKHFCQSNPTKPSADKVLRVDLPPINP